MKLELGIIRSAFRGPGRVGGGPLVNWSLGAREFKLSLGSFAMASLTINGNAGNPTVSSTGPVSLV